MFWFWSLACYGDTLDFMLVDGERWSIGIGDKIYRNGEELPKGVKKIEILEGTGKHDKIVVLYFENGTVLRLRPGEAIPEDEDLYAI